MLTAYLSLSLQCLDCVVQSQLMICTPSQRQGRDVCEKPKYFRVFFVRKKKLKRERRACKNFLVLKNLRIKLLQMKKEMR